MVERALSVVVAAAAASIATVASAQAGRVLTCDAVIEAPIEEVWAAFTTEEGMESWMVPVGSIDLRIGGEWRTSYNAESDLNDGDTIVHTILAYEPGRMISVRTTPPAAAAEVFGGVDFSQLWSVFRFEPVDGGTRVSVTGLGYGEGEAWDRVHDFFQVNNPLVLDELARHFGHVDGPRETGALSPDGQRVMDLLHRWVGGEWVHEGSPPGGGVFRVRNIVTEGPDRVSLLCEGWLGGEDGMHPHSLAIIRRSVDGGVWFENVNENGDVARGRITLAGDDTLHWAWGVSHLDGSTQRYSIDTTFPDDADAYSMKLGVINTDEGGIEAVTPLVDVVFTRVERAPEEFLRLTPQPAQSSGSAGGE